MMPFATPQIGGVASATLAAVAYKTAESLADKSTTNTEISLVSMSLSASEQTANAKYLGLWSGMANATNNTGFNSALYVGGVLSRQDYFQMNDPPQDDLCVGGAFIHDAGAVPSDTSFDIKFNSTSATSTATGREGRISLLKLGADDYYTLPADFTTSATTLTTAATFNFTPASTGNYLILVSFWGQARCYFQVSDGTTTTTERASVPFASGSRLPVMVLMRLSAVSGAKAITLKVRTSNGITPTTASGITMVAIREDRFANVYATRLASDSTGTGSATPLTQTFTPAAGDHLTLCAGTVTSGSTSLAGYFNYEDGATVVADETTTIRTAGTSLCNTLVSHAIATYPASSRTQKITRNTEGANNASVYADTAIVTLSLIGLT